MIVAFSSLRRTIALAAVVAAALSGCTAPSSSSPSASVPSSDAPSTTPANPASASPSPSGTPTPAESRSAADPLRGMVIDPAAKLVPSRGGAILAPVAGGPLSGRTIVVDPGHNGRYRAPVNTRQVPAGGGHTKPCNSSGTASAAGYSEHEFNWDVGKRLTGNLRELGAKVILTRPDDYGTGPCVNERAAIGNRAKADLLISIHADGNPSPKARGFHLILSTAMLGGSAVETSSERLALLLRRTIESRTGMPRSTYIGNGTALSPRTDIGGLNLSRIPGIMLEAGNLRQRDDLALLTSARFRGRLAEALADGARQALRT